MKVQITFCREPVMPKAQSAGVFVVFIGRFQPFHKGHEKILGRLLRQYGRVVVAIGSSGEKRTKDNPFSARERAEMIKKVARSHAGWMRKIRFVYLADNSSNAEWVKKIAARFPPACFDVTSANLLVRKLLGRAGYALHPSPLFARVEWEGKKLRAAVRAGKNIRSRLPRALKKWMKEKGEKTIRAC